MRASLVWSLVLAASSLSVPAFAAKPKPEPAPEAAPAAAEETPADAMMIKPVGVADIDLTFSKAEEPLDTLRAVRGHLTELHTHVVTALALPAGTPIADALADLDQKAGDKIMVAIDTKGMPHLEASDAIPANLQSAMDAFNDGVRDIEASAEKFALVPGQIKEVSIAASQINADTLTKSGVSATEIPKKTKLVQHNVKVLRSAQTEAEAIKVELDGMRTAVEATFKKM